MKFSLRRTIFALCICTAAIVGYGFWHAAVEAKSVAVADLQNQIVTKTNTASRISSSRASLVQIAGDEEIMRSYFVPETGVVAFIDALETEGKKQGTTVTVSSVSSASATTVMSALTLSLTIDGAFGAVMSTIGAIEYAPYDLIVSALSVSRDSQNGWRATMDILVGSVSASQMATSTL